MKKIFERIISSISSILLFIFGDFDFLIKVMLSLMFIDYITGICKSFATKKINSSIGAIGIIKKVVYFCVIATSVLLDKVLNFNGSLRTFVITTFIFNEMLSIFENSSEIGIKVPKILYKILEKIKNDNEEN